MSLLFSLCGLWTGSWDLLSVKKLSLRLSRKKPPQILGSWVCGMVCDKKKISQERDWGRQSCALRVGLTVRKGKVPVSVSRGGVLMGCIRSWCIRVPADFKLQGQKPGHLAYGKEKITGSYNWEELEDSELHVISPAFGEWIDSVFSHLPLLSLSLVLILLPFLSTELFPQSPRWLQC